MSEAGRKLTIRMPDNPRLRSVEVGQLHVDPGGRVQNGGPVMSLTKRRKDHIVRAPRPGRVVPLVAVGDTIQPGDPLYILHIDEAALAVAKQEARALVPVEQKKWASGIKPEAIVPVAREAKSDPWLERLQQFVGEWGKPVLAIALYVLACFALLPILNAFSGTASMPMLLGMLAGCVVFGAMIYYLYAPNAGAGPRWTVRLVAASWIGISSLAIFSQPKDAEDLTLADATERIGEIFAPEVLVPSEAPVTVPTPAPVLASGVAVDRWRQDDVVPDHKEPQSVLAEVDGALATHGVTVRVWGRVNPPNSSGDEIGFDLADVTPEAVTAGGETARAEAPSDVTLAELDEATRIVPEALPRLALADVATPQDAETVLSVPAEPAAPVVSALSDGGAARDLVAPGFVEATIAAEGAGSVPEQLPLDPVTQVLALVLAEDSTGPEAPDRIWSGGTISTVPDFNAQSVNLAGSAGTDTILASPAVPAEAPGGWTSVEGIPVILTKAAANPTEPGASWAGSIASASAARSASPVEPSPSALPARLGAVKGGAPDTWLTTGGVPVPQAAMDTAPDAPDTSWQRTEFAAAAPVRRDAPEALRVGGSPDLILVSAVRSGDDLWMEAQAALLNADTVRQSRVPPGAAVKVLRDTKVLTPDASTGGADLAVPDAPNLLAFATSEGQPSPQDVMLDLPSVSASVFVAPLAAKDLDALQVSSTADAFPSLPPAPPDFEERLLLFVYFDDPRLKSHPGIGDRWTPQVSPGLAGAMDTSTVEAVKQIVQVERWCAAASDPILSSTEARTAWLNDRIRLLQVRVSVQSDRIADFEQEVGLFDGTPAGFFHNKAPVLGAQIGEPLLEDGMAYLRSLAAGLIDPDAGEVMQGGQYFDSPVALATILKGAGCDRAEWNGGGAPDNAIGRHLDQALGG